MMAIAEMTPDPIALNAATFVGIRMDSNPLRCKKQGHPTQVSLFGFYNKC